MSKTNKNAENFQMVTSMLSNFVPIVVVDVQGFNEALGIFFIPVGNFVFFLHCLLWFWAHFVVEIFLVQAKNLPTSNDGRTCDHVWVLLPSIIRSAKTASGETAWGEKVQLRPLFWWRASRRVHALHAIWWLHMGCFNLLNAVIWNGSLVDVIIDETPFFQEAMNSENQTSICGNEPTTSSYKSIFMENTEKWKHRIHDQRGYFECT